MENQSNMAIEFSLKAERKDFEQATILGSSDIDEFARKFYFDDIEIFESCFIILLNRQHRTLGFAKISQGGICTTIVDVRIICKYAIEALATDVVFVHNHPSGVCKPSRGDIDITRDLKKALGILDINLLDSVILTPQNGYYSFMDETGLAI